jgi:hypothetical protein
MAKSKKSKPIAVKKPRDPERARRMRVLAINLFAVAFCVGAIAVGLHFDQKYVEHKVVFAKEPPAVVLKNRPVWMSDFLAEQIARTARPAGAHSAFDHQMLVDTVAMLRSNPWIREVRQVRRAYGKQPGDTLEVDCEYRAPVALVQWKNYFWLVDGDGVKLPEAFTVQDVPRIVTGQDRRLNIRVIEGVRQPPPETGAKWVGEDLHAGLELVKLLFGRQYTEEIPKVNVANFGGRFDPKGAQLVLITKYGTTVRWGRPIAAGDDFFVEVSPAQKLAYMQAIYEEKHRVDGNFDWVDVRFDAVTHPSTGPAQTANAELQR